MDKPEKCDLYPGVLFYQPMLVGKNPYEDVGELAHKPGWMATVKKDGYWESLVKWNNKVYMFARSKSKQTGWYTEKSSHVPHLVEWAKECLPDKTVLIGEAYVPGGTSKEVTKILGCSAEKAIERQKYEGNLHYYIHDIVFYEGADYVSREIPYGRRYSDICVHFDIAQKHPDFIEVPACGDSVYMNFNAMFERILGEGEEGLVIRRESGLYLPGKRRPKEMFKMKRSEDSLDFIVTDILEPEKLYQGKDVEGWPYKESTIERKPFLNAWGEPYYRENKHETLVTKAYYYNWAGGFQLGLVNEKGEVENFCKVTSGLSDEIREDAALNPDDYIGYVVEIQAMSVDNERRSVRHPAFVKMRPDKDVSECTVESVFGK